MTLVLLVSFEHIAKLVGLALLYRVHEESSLHNFIDDVLHHRIELENTLPKVQHVGVQLLSVDLVVRQVQRKVNGELLLDKHQQVNGLQPVVGQIDGKTVHIALLLKQLEKVREVPHFV